MLNDLSCLIYSSISLVNFSLSFFDLKNEPFILRLNKKRLYTLQIPLEIHIKNGIKRNINFQFHLYKIIIELNNIIEIRRETHHDHISQYFLIFPILLVLNSFIPLLYRKRKWMQF